MICMDSGRVVSNAVGRIIAAGMKSNNQVRGTEGKVYVRRMRFSHIGINERLEKILIPYHHST